MSYKKLIGDVTLGGSGVNNPVPLTITNYYLSASEAELPLTQQNIIYYDSSQLISLQVTGLVLYDTATGRPMLGSTDPVYFPCPPACTGK